MNSCSSDRAASRSRAVADAYEIGSGSGYMAAMGYTNGKKPKVIFDSMRKYGDDGQMRALMIRYVQEKGTITPKCDHNWNVIK